MWSKVLKESMLGVSTFKLSSNCLLVWKRSGRFVHIYLVRQTLLIKYYDVSLRSDRLLTVGYIFHSYASSGIFKTPSSQPPESLLKVQTFCKLTSILHRKTHLKSAATPTPSKIHCVLWSSTKWSETTSPVVLQPCYAHSTALKKNTLKISIKQQITDYRSQITDYISQITDHRSQITDHQSRRSGQVHITPHHQSTPKFLIL